MQSARKKIALVTGANKGIGFEVARQLAASGCIVLLGARNPVLGEEAATRLKPADVRNFAIDLDDSATITAAAQAIEAGFGHPVVLAEPLDDLDLFLGNILDGLEEDDQEQDSDGS